MQVSGVNLLQWNVLLLSVLEKNPRRPNILPLLCIWVKCAGVWGKNTLPFIKLYPMSKVRMSLSKLLPQTSKYFTQIYLPYLWHYATLCIYPAVVGSLWAPSAQHCGNIPFQGKWLWQFKEETKRGPTSKSAHRGERVRRVERREKRGDWVSEVLPGASYQLPPLTPKGEQGTPTCTAIHCLQGWVERIKRGVHERT